MQLPLCCALCCTLRTPCAGARGAVVAMNSALCSSCPIGTLPGLEASLCYKRAFQPMTFAQCIQYCATEPGWRLPCLTSQAETMHLASMLFNRSYFWVGVVQTSKDDEPAGNWQRIGCDENADTGMWWYPGEPNDDHGSEECAIAGVNIAEEWSLPSCADGCWFDAPCAPDASWQVACVCETHLGGSIQLEVLGALDAAARSVRASVRATDREALRTLVWILITLGLSAAPAFLTWLCITVSRKLKDSRQRSPRVYDLPGSEESATDQASSQRLLLRMRAEANQLQWWVSFGFAQAGWVCIVFFVMFSVAIGALSGCEEDPSRLCPPIWPLKYLFAFLSLFGPAVVFSLLSVLPTDRVKVQVVGYAVATFTLLLTLTMIWFAVRAMTSPSPNNSSHVNSFLVFMYLTNGMVGFGPAALAIMPVLRCPLCCTKPVPPRKVLGRIWAASRHTLVVMSVTFLAFFINNVSDPRHESDTSSDTKYSTTYAVSPMFPSVMILFCAAISKPTMRQRAHAAIGRLASRGQSQQAASVAALVGRIGASEAKKRADATFCALPIDRLVLADLDKGSGAEGARVLRDKVIPLVLGECSAFVSHSWYDDPSAKFEVLSAWGRDAKRAMGKGGDGGGGRQSGPTIWLDRACIDQTDIESALAVLPLYLSGCTQLLVVSGPSYITRLWCVIELFTFLRMGGTPERVVLLPLPEEPSAQSEVPPLTSEQRYQAALGRFAAFRAEDANCYNDNDKQHLLGVIEGGFGSFAAFNDCIRTIFVQGKLGRAGK